MNKKILLSVYQTRNPFNSLLMYEEYQGFYPVTMRNSKRAVRKVKKMFSDADILLKKGSEKEKIISGKIKKKNNFSCDVILPVIEKICRQMTEKYKLSLPLQEVYIMASPPFACAMVVCLLDIAKVFTVVSPETPFLNMYDEIYFKHGTIIRHLPQFNTCLSQNSMIIRCNNEDFPLWSKIPIIDMCEKAEITDFMLRIGDVMVKDDSINYIADKWGGIPGISLYDFFGLIPSEKVIVDINKKADEIFLLDTEQI